MADVVTRLLHPLEARYSWKDSAGEFPPEKIERLKRDYVDAFKGYGVDDLEAAARWIVLHRRFSTMPTVGDVTSVIENIVAERKAAEQKTRARQSGISGSREEFIKRLKQDREDAQTWAREWLTKTYLGKLAIEEGWCRHLYNLIWQIKLNRSRSNAACEYDDIKLDDIATETTGGDDLIKYWRSHCRAINPVMECKIVLREPL